MTSETLKEKIEEEIVAAEKLVLLKLKEKIYKNSLKKSKIYCSVHEIMSLIDEQIDELED
jgi:hypothetical protein